MKPIHPHVPSMQPLIMHAPIPKLWVVFWESEHPIRALSFACGRQYGLAFSPPCPRGGRDTLAGFFCRSPRHPHAYIWAHTNTEYSWIGSQPPLPPPPILLGAGPWIGDMWQGQMRHEAGLSLRQILCLTACLPVKLPGWNDSQKQRRSFVFCPSDCSNRPPSQLPSASGNCCLSSWHFAFLSLTASWLQSLFSLSLWCCSCCLFLMISYLFSKRGTQMFLCFATYIVYLTCKTVFIVMDCVFLV